MHHQHALDHVLQTQTKFDLHESELCVLLQAKFEVSLAASPPQGANTVDMQLKVWPDDMQAKTIVAVHVCS